MMLCNKYYRIQLNHRQMEKYKRINLLNHNTGTSRIISPSLQQKQLRMMIGQRNIIIKSKIQDDPEKYGFKEVKKILTSLSQVKLPVIETNLQEVQEIKKQKHRKNHTFQQERLNELCQNLLNENRERKLFGFDTDIILSERLPKVREKKQIVQKKHQLTHFLQNKDTRFIESPRQNKQLRRQNMIPNISTGPFCNQVETSDMTPQKNQGQISFEDSLKHLNQNYSVVWDQMLDKNLSKSKIDFFQNKLRSPQKRLYLSNDTRKSKHFQFFENLKAEHEYGLEDIVFYQNQIKLIQNID